MKNINYNLVYIKVWLSYLNRYHIFTGIIKDKVFFPVCEGCIYNIPSCRFMDVPVLRVLVKKLKEKNIIPYGLRTYCNKQKKTVGFPKSCEHRTEVPEI